MHGALRLCNTIVAACSTWTTMIRFGAHRAHTLQGFARVNWTVAAADAFACYSRALNASSPPTSRRRPGQHFRVILRVQLTAKMRVTHKIIVKSHSICVCVCVCVSDDFYVITEEYEIPTSTQCDNIDLDLTRK
uniref:Uncharacterized protein n=1 Tax=Sipha flava TaxID=143950 RepID=A0A2S2QHG0_9HEMI